MRAVRRSSGPSSPPPLRAGRGRRELTTIPARGTRSLSGVRRARIPPMRVTVRLYGSMGDFVARARRGAAFEYEAGEPRSVKDLVESLGVPHCEVQIVLVDGTGVPFDRVLRGGER